MDTDDYDYDDGDDERLAPRAAPSWPPLPATILQIPPVLGQPPGHPAAADRQRGRAGPPAGPARDDGSHGAGQPPEPPEPKPPEPEPPEPPAADHTAGTRRAPPGLLDLTISWRLLAGEPAAPAHLGRIGPITAGQALPLAGIAALDPAAQWRVILTDADDHALAVERVRRRRNGDPGEPDGRAQGVVGRVTVIVPARVLGDQDPGTATGGGIKAAILRAGRRAAARAEEMRAADATAPGGCAHTMAAPGYRPPTRIREHVEARDQTCRSPVCRQPAWRADLDHTLAFHRGGLTCPCNLGGGCRAHHQLKQLPGWTLTQASPGHFEWTTPAGRTYASEPDTYPS
jgi:hypothetical protein